MVVSPGGGTAAEENGESGFGGGAVDGVIVEDVPGDVRLVTDVDVVHPGLDAGVDDDAAETVEGADPVDEDVGAAQQRVQLPRVGDVDGECLSGEFVGQVPGPVSVAVGGEEGVPRGQMGGDFFCDGAGDGTGPEDGERRHDGVLSKWSASPTLVNVVDYRQG